MATDMLVTMLHILIILSHSRYWNQHYIVGMRIPFLLLKMVGNIFL